MEDDFDVDDEEAWAEKFKEMNEANDEVLRDADFTDELVELDDDE